MRQGSWVVCAALLMAAFGYTSAQKLAARALSQPVSAIRQTPRYFSAQWRAASGPRRKTGGPEAYSTPPQASAAGELKAAVAAEKAGQYSEAADHYRNFLKMEAARAAPKALSEVRVRLATDQFMAHRYEDSLQSLRPILESKASLAAATIPAQAWIVAGLDHLQLNRLDGAIRNLRQALQVDPASGTARLALGDALARSGHLQEAAEQYRNQTQRTPKVVEAWYKLGVAEAQLAKETSSSFTAQHPKDQVAEMLVAETYLSRDDGLGAAKILLPLVEDNNGASRGKGDSRPERSGAVLPGVHADLGQAFLEESYVHAAASEFRKELELDPESAPAGFGLAETATLNSNWNSVLSHLRRLMLSHAQDFKRRLESQPPAPLRAAWNGGHLQVPVSFASSSEGRLWQSWFQGNGMSGVRIESTQQNSCSSLPAHARSIPGLWLTESCYARLIRQLNGRASQKGNRTNAERAK
ncbi:MAG: tetratricopeptide repeat protein, partial [Terriglobia bacterium]